MIPDNVEKIIMTKEDYDRNVEQMILEKIEYERRIEKAITKIEWTNFKMVDNCDKLFRYLDELLNILRGEDEC